MSKDLTPIPNQFDDAIAIIDNAHSRAMRAVNAELINMYWEIGAYVSERVESVGWGKSVLLQTSLHFCNPVIPHPKAFQLKTFGV